MSLYQLSKLLFLLNREEAAKRLFHEDANQYTQDFSLTDEERRAVVDRNIGLLYVLGVNGQILMYFAALCGIAWSDYLQMMRDGVLKYGPVREGLYAMTTSADERPAGL